MTEPHSTLTSEFVISRSRLEFLADGIFPFTPAQPWISGLCYHYCVFLYVCYKNTRELGGFKLNEFLEELFRRE
jgi:hypothetical protein